jgi:hypothetical protein
VTPPAPAAGDVDIAMTTKAATEIVASRRVGCRPGRRLGSCAIADPSLSDPAIVRLPPEAGKGETTTDAARSCRDQDQHRDDESDVQQHTDDRDGHVGAGLVHPRLSSKRRQHPKQDREEGDGESDHHRSGRDLVASVEHRAQGPEEGHTEDHRDGETEPRVGKVLLAES